MKEKNGKRELVTWHICTLHWKIIRVFSCPWYLSFMYSDDIAKRADNVVIFCVMSCEI